MEELLKIVGNNVKYYRFKQDLTQEQLANAIDKTVRYVSYLENGSINVPLKTLYIIADVLKVDPYLLLKPTEHEDLPNKVNMKNK